MMTERPIRIKLTHPGDQRLRQRAEWFRERPGICWRQPLLEERPAALDVLEGLDESQEAQGLAELQISRKGVVLLAGEEKLHFHPSMALLRLINLERGEGDRFLAATGLCLGDSLLDATLGLGSDALVAAAAVGAQGKVVGLEQAGILAALVEDGLATLSQVEGTRALVSKRVSAEKARAWSSLQAAAARIQVRFGEHFTLLSKLPDQAFDVVYFDPMFRRTRTKSASIRPLHPYAEHAELSLQAVAEAFRVARKRVVLKERKGSTEFTRLGFQVVPSGRYSQVDYGVIEKEMRFCTP